MADALDLLWPVVVLVVLTYLFGLVEVSHAADTTLLEACTGTFVVFGLFLLLFNGLAALLLDQAFLADQLPQALAPWSPYFAVVLGVACFQGVVKHANVTLFTHIPLDFEAWVGKAQDLASEAANQHRVDKREEKAVAFAKKLSGIPEKELNVFVDANLGSGTAAQLEEAAQKSQADSVLFKALTLAKEKPDAARAVVKEFAGS